MAVAISLDEELDVGRGDVLSTRATSPRSRGTSRRCSSGWTAGRWRRAGRTSSRIGTGAFRGHRLRAPLRHRRDDLKRVSAGTLGQNEIGRAALTLTRAVPHDPYSRNRSMGALVLEEAADHRILAAGMVLSTQPPRRDPAGRPRRASLVTPAERERLLGQRPVTSGSPASPPRESRRSPSASRSGSWTRAIPHPSSTEPRCGRGSATISASARPTGPVRRPPRRGGGPDPQRRRARRHRGARLPLAADRRLAREIVGAARSSRSMRGSASACEARDAGRGLCEGPAGRAGALPRRHVPLRGPGISCSPAADRGDRPRRGDRPGGPRARRARRPLAGELTTGLPCPGFLRDDRAPFG